MAEECWSSPGEQSSSQQWSGGVANERLDMSGRAAEALAGANVQAVVRVEGRDVVIGGVGTADQARVNALLESIAGVREVEFTDTQPAATPPAPVATTAPVTTLRSLPTARPAPPPAAAEQVARPTYISARLEAGAITIEGVVPSEAAAARIAAVADLIYAPFVTNDAEVDASAGTAPWIDTVADGIAVLPIVGTAHLILDDRTVLITGSAATENIADQLAGAVQSALGRGMVVEPRLTITGLDPPSFAAHINAVGDVVLAGVVPTAEIAAAIVEGPPPPANS